MSTSSKAGSAASLPPLKRALIAIDGLKRRLDEVEMAKHEPIAVVGMGCRLPGGVRDPESFWRLLEEGRDAVQEIPSERFDVDRIFDPEPAKPGKTNSRWGAFVDDIAGFDPSFFGISAREAIGMDPQQRMSLEVAWEAIENAGIAPDRLSGCRVGVYLGLATWEYMLSHPLSSKEISGIHSVGNAHSIASGRISHFLNLKGPSLSIDSACSSSLSAVHLAVRSLRSGETDVALAGGVNASLYPDTWVVLSRGGMMDPSGRCRAFDADGKGFVRGEGCGVVVLKRLSDALAAGDPIWAVVRGTASHQDGRSAGVTAPCGIAQETVIREALADAGRPPEAIGYVESHGTGTPLGDPIEMEALKTVFGDAAAGERCAIGAVKTNIGHLEAAAGIAGFIKAVLVLAHETVPANLHFKKLSPYISLDGSCLEVPTANRALLPREGHRRCAGVSSFGFSGTNVHTVLEEAPVEPAAGESRPAQILALSAASSSALDQVGAEVATFLDEHPEVDLADVAHTLRVGRSRLPHRRLLVARDREDATSVLRAADPTRLFETVSDELSRPVAFLFSGLGDQYAGMGAELYSTEPTFRRLVDEGCETLRPLIGRDVLALLYPPAAKPEPSSASGGGIDLRQMLAGRGGRKGGSTDPLHQTLIGQPATLVVEYALAQLLMEWGVRPRAVMGHSLGEITAACVAGVFSFADGLRLAAKRAQLIEEEMPAGGMCAASLSEDELRPLLPSGVSLAAVNAPALCVASGSIEGLEALEEGLRSRGVTHRRMAASHAYHSTSMERIAGRLAEFVGSLERHPARMSVVSNVTGDWLLPDAMAEPEYWARHLCATVRFADGATTLWSQDPSMVFVEVGPGQALGSFAHQLPVESGAARMVLPTIRASYDKQRDLDFLLASVGKLWLSGVEVDWDGFAAHEDRRNIRLPVYPFQHARYWPSAAGSEAVAPIAEAARSPVWKRDRGSVRPTDVAGDRPCVVLSRTRETGAAFAAHLIAGGRTVIWAHEGETFEFFGDNRFSIDLSDAEDLDEILKYAWGSTGAAPQIVNVVGLDPVASGDGDAAAGDAKVVARSTAALADALDRGGLRQDVELMVVTSHAESPTPGADLSSPIAIARSAGQALCHRLPSGHARMVDVAVAGPADLPAAIAAVAQELALEAGSLRVAHRAGRRWERKTEPVSRTAPADESVLAGDVLLVVRSADPVDDALTRILEGRADVRVVEADAASVVDTAARLSDERIPVRGVLVSVGERPEPTNGSRDPERTPTHWIDPLCAEAEMLRRVVERLAPEFVVLLSRFDEPMHAEPLAAEAIFFEACAAVQVVSLRVAPGADLAEMLDPAQLDAIIDAGRSRMDLLAAVEVPPERPAQESAPGTAEALTSGHGRPDLLTPYVAPRDEIEERLTALWVDLLATESIGVHDSFLELGGNSLMATDLAYRVHSAFGRILPLQDFFAAPTISGLAETLRREAGASGDAGLTCSAESQIATISP
ncbi:MAG: beta-ketoacyl synthase N-terminal-like domain-containing protein [Candidatus Binatia bacterium]|nr:beta-ketoacyl synthase N-terminal-like domain-containing protein [Candidatus Binatia bacterium]